MAGNNTEANVVVTLNGEAAKDELKELTKQMDFYREAAAEAYKQGKKAIGDEMTKNYVRMQKEVKVTSKEMKDFSDVIKNLNTKSINELKNAARGLERQLKTMAPDDKDFAEKAKQYKTITERVKSLEKAYKAVSDEQSKTPNIFKRSFKAASEFFGGIMLGIDAFKRLVKGVSEFASHVIHSSQTMGDAWDNAVTAMKTTTEAFFVALSTGNWDAFNGGLREAIKNAKEYAATLDQLESRRISNDYMQSQYLTNYREDMVTANDKSQDEATRQAALESAKQNLAEYINSIEKLGSDTRDNLMASYKAMFGIDYTGDELGFEKFFDELYKNVIVGENETVNQLIQERDNRFTELRNQYTVAGDQIVYTYSRAQAMALANREAENKYGTEVYNLAKAYEQTDDALKANLESFKQYTDAKRQATRYEKQLNTESATFEKQIESEKAAAAKKALEDKKAAAAAAYEAQMKQIEKERYATQQHYAEMYMKGEIDKKAYDAQMIVIEDAYLAEKLALNQRFGKDTDAISQTILDRQIKRYEEAKKTIKALVDDEANFDENYKPQWQIDEEDEYESKQKQRRKDSYNQYDESLSPLVQKAEEIRASIQETNLRSEYETELLWIEKLHEKKMLSEEEFEAAKLKLRMDYAAKAAQATADIADKASNLISAIQGAETANLEAAYQAQLTAAGDNAEQREKIEAAYEQRKLDIQKKYADADMVMNIAKTTANGAVAAIKAYAEGGPYAGPILAAIIAATTAAEIATIIAQRNAIKNSSVSSSGSGSGLQSGIRTINEGYAEGGYTGAGGKYEPAGIVHRGEWVAPKWMVRQNPVTFANMERYRRSGSHGRSGSSVHGFADGGYTSPVSVSPTGGPIELSEASAMMIADAIAAKGITIVQLDKALSDKHAQDNRFKKITAK